MVGPKRFQRDGDASRMWSVRNVALGSRGRDDNCFGRLSDRSSRRVLVSPLLCTRPELAMGKFDRAS